MKYIVFTSYQNDMMQNTHKGPGGFIRNLLVITEFRAKGSHDREQFKKRP